MNNHKYKIAIAIPNYNTPELYLDSCISSIEQVIKRDFLSKEDVIVIIRDDGSTEERYKTLEFVIRKYSDALNIDLGRREERLGTSPTRQELLDCALNDHDCEYIYFLDSDDMLCINDNLKTLYDMARSEKIPMLRSGVYKVDVDDKVYDVKLDIQLLFSMVGILYDLDFIRKHGLKFPDYKYCGCEDSLFNQKIRIYTDPKDMQDLYTYAIQRRLDSNFTIVTNNDIERLIMDCQTIFYSYYIFENVGHEYLDRAIELFNDFNKFEECKSSELSDRIIYGYTYTLLFKYLPDYVKRYYYNIDPKNTFLLYMKALSRNTKIDLSTCFPVIYNNSLRSYKYEAIRPYIEKMLNYKMYNSNGVSVNGLDERFLNF